ncbi:hypothetical protein [Faecalibacter sp. LW9]|uniref:hypothetical protein n=1 Tax=Faecalibacter sp. LW9 TaxID=3103144 RepID=UPI002AFE839B|nr:hypothetical protein [Faecalibacter sp. LW9]
MKKRFVFTAFVMIHLITYSTNKNSMSVSNTIDNNRIDFFSDPTPTEDPSNSFFNAFKQDERDEVQLVKECVVDPLTNECYPADIEIPVSIHHKGFVLLWIGVYLIFHFRNISSSKMY